MRMVKRAALLALCLLLLVPAGKALAYAPNGPSDYALWEKDGAQYAWAKPDIEDTLRYEIFLGYDMGSETITLSNGETLVWKRVPEYRPGNPISRSEYAAVLARAIGVDTYTGPVQGFTDIPADVWYAPYVAGLEAKGVIKHEEYGGKFDATVPITRVEIATWTARAGLTVGLKDPQVKPAFADLNPQNPHYQDIAVAVGLNIVHGIPDGSQVAFKPNATATRAEAAAMIMRLTRQLTMNPPKIEDLQKVIQGSFDSIGLFLKEHKSGYPADDEFRTLGQYFTEPNLLPEWYDRPTVDHPVDSIGGIIYDGNTIGTAFNHLRAWDPKVWYGDVKVVSVAPIALGSNWSAVRVQTIATLHTYDAAKLPDTLQERDFYLKLVNGSWKIGGCSRGTNLKVGFNLTGQ
ncbi:MAG: S-layer homology domain-containing protein [Bacillota bacterium]